MRTFLFLAFCFFLQNSYSQEKQDNTIIVRGTSQRAVAEGLHQKGFRVAFDGFNRFTTIPKILDNHGELVIMVEVKDSTAYISGTFEGNEITPDLFKHKESYGGHYLGNTFQILQDFATTLNGHIAYAKM